MAHFNPVGGPPGGGFPYDAPHQGHGTQRNDGRTSIGRALRGPIETMVGKAIKNGSQGPLASIDYFSKMFEEPADNTGAAGYRPPQQAGMHPFPDGAHRHVPNDGVGQPPSFPARHEPGGDWQMPPNHGFHPAATQQAGYSRPRSGGSHVPDVREGMSPHDQCHGQVREHLGDVPEMIRGQLLDFMPQVEAMFRRNLGPVLDKMNSLEQRNEVLSERVSRMESGRGVRAPQARWSDAAPVRRRNRSNHVPNWLRDDASNATAVPGVAEPSHRPASTAHSLSSSESDSDEEYDTDGRTQRRVRPPVLKVENPESSRKNPGENEDGQMTLASNSAKNQATAIIQYVQMDGTGRHQSEILSRNH